MLFIIGFALFALGICGLIISCVLCVRRQKKIVSADNKGIAIGGDAKAVVNTGTMNTGDITVTVDSTINKNKRDSFGIRALGFLSMLATISGFILSLFNWK